MKDKNTIKPFQVRIPHDLWVYTKKAAIDQETSMNEIITRCLEKFKNNREKRLTSDDTAV